MIQYFHHADGEAWRARAIFSPGRYRFQQMFDDRIQVTNNGDSRCMLGCNCRHEIVRKKNPTATPPQKKLNGVSNQLSAWATVNTSRWRWPDTRAARVCVHVHLLSVCSPATATLTCHFCLKSPCFRTRLHFCCWSSRDYITHTAARVERERGEGRKKKKENGPCLKVLFPWKWWQTVQGEERFNKVAGCLHCSVPRGHHTHTHTHTHTPCNNPVLLITVRVSFFFSFTCGAFKACCY